VNIKSQKDFFAGLMFMSVGVAFAWGATNYPIGDGARMGPGYFPLVLGVLLAILGGLITFQALVLETEVDDRIGAFAWRPLIFIILANVVFGVLLGGLPSIGLPPMGMVIAIYALTFIASAAGEEFSVKTCLILASVLAVGSYLAFIVVLKLQFPVWPAFITG
jgi:hypothetical protein